MTTKWSRRSVVVGAAAAAATAGPAAAQLFQTQQAAKSAALNPLIANTPGRQYLGPAGYSARFRAVREYLAAGQISQAVTTFEAGGLPSAQPASQDPDVVAEAQSNAAGAQTEDGAAQGLNRRKDTFLRNAELGFMRFELGEYANSTTHFREAEDFYREKEEKKASRGMLGKMKAGIKRGGTALVSTVSGRGDFGPYRQRDYEEVMQLNYLSLAYLLQGDRRAYNVSRRASERQNFYFDKYREEIDEAQENLKTGGDAQKFGFDTISRALEAEFTGYQRVVERVPSAYVNPIGPYLTGVIQEIVSYEQPALRDNARIAYSRALELWPKSKQLDLMTAAMASPVNPDERVVHVLVSEAFSPNRNLLRYGIQDKEGNVVPIRMGVFVPGESPIGNLELQLSDSTKPGRAPAVTSIGLESLGDFEAIIQRAQDQRKFTTILDVATAMFRDSYLSEYSQLSQQLFGISLDSVPDLRSWNALPRRVHLARIVAPAYATEATLISRAPNGTVISKAKVPLQQDMRQTFVYGRAHGSELLAETPKRLWIDGTLVEDDESPVTQEG